jgi:ribosome-binding protein aMBF1 (putative translation factor)
MAMGEQSNPVGATVSDHIAESLEDAAFRAECDRLRPYEEFARIVIERRAALGLTQAELAAGMGTTPSVVSRIESGQHATNAKTFKKLAHALGVRAVFGFEAGSAEQTERELVTL